MEFIASGAKCKCNLRARSLERFLCKFMRIEFEWKHLVGIEESERKRCQNQIDEYDNNCNSEHSHEWSKMSRHETSHRFAYHWMTNVLDIVVGIIRITFDEIGFLKIIFFYWHSFPLDQNTHTFKCLKRLNCLFFFQLHLHSQNTWTDNFFQLVKITIELKLGITSVIRSQLIIRLF